MTLSELSDQNPWWRDETAIEANYKAKALQIMRK